MNASKTSAKDTQQAVVVVLVVLVVGVVVATAISGESQQVFGVQLPFVALAIALGINAVAFFPAYRHQTEHYYDLTGSITYLSVIAAAWFGGNGSARSSLLAILVMVWALRLGWFLFHRIQRAGKDGRFDRIKPSAPRFLVAWMLQGLWVFLTSCAAVAAMSTTTPASWSALDAVGLGVWLCGFTVEVVADRQKSAFKREHPDGFIDSGLWAWSRHPNYAGEIVLWVGVAIIASPTLAGWTWAAWISPLFVYLLLTRVSGIPMLERRADARWGADASYLAYKARTPVLWPRPPRAQP